MTKLSIVNFCIREKLDRAKLSEILDTRETILRLKWQLVNASIFLLRARENSWP